MILQADSTVRFPIEDESVRGNAKADSVVVTSGRNRRTVWTIPTQPSPEVHFAAFPEALVEPCVLAGSGPGDVVLDPFSGTGTVVKVAQRLGRKGIALELSSEYCRIARDRTWQSARQAQFV